MSGAAPPVRVVPMATALACFVALAAVTAGTGCQRKTNLRRYVVGASDDLAILGDCDHRSTHAIEVDGAAHVFHTRHAGHARFNCNGAVHLLYVEQAVTLAIEGPAHLPVAGASIRYRLVARDEEKNELAIGAHGAVVWDVPAGFERDPACGGEPCLPNVVALRAPVAASGTLRATLSDMPPPAGESHLPGNTALLLIGAP
jgi:hypothetical protein